MLSLLCLHVVKNKTIPEKRSDLYNSLFKTMLSSIRHDRNDVIKKYIKNNNDRYQKIIEETAFELYFNEKTKFYYDDWCLTYGKLLEHNKLFAQGLPSGNDAYFDLLNIRLLKESESGAVEFIHPSMHELLCGKAIARQLNKGTQKIKHGNKDYYLKKEFLNGLLSTIEYRLMFTFVIRYLDDPTYFLKYMGFNCIESNIFNRKLLGDTEEFIKFLEKTQSIRKFNGYQIETLLYLLLEISPNNRILYKENIAIITSIFTCELYNDPGLFEIKQIANILNVCVRLKAYVELTNGKVILLLDFLQNEIKYANFRYGIRGDPEFVVLMYIVLPFLREHQRISLIKSSINIISSSSVYGIFKNTNNIKSLIVNQICTENELVVSVNDIISTNLSYCNINLFSEIVYKYYEFIHQENSKKIWLLINDKLNFFLYKHYDKNTEKEWISSLGKRDDENTGSELIVPLFMFCAVYSKYVKTPEAIGLIIKFFKKYFQLFFKYSIDYGENKIIIPFLLTQEFNEIREIFCDYYLKKEEFHKSTFIYGKYEKIFTDNEKKQAINGLFESVQRIDVKLCILVEKSSTEQQNKILKKRIVELLNNTEHTRFFDRIDVVIIDSLTNTRIVTDHQWILLFNKLLDETEKERICKNILEVLDKRVKNGQFQVNNNDIDQLIFGFNQLLKSYNSSLNLLLELFIAFIAFIENIGQKNKSLFIYFKSRLPFQQKCLLFKYNY